MSEEMERNSKSPCLSEESLLTSNATYYSANSDTLAYFTREISQSCDIPEKSSGDLLLKMIDCNEHISTLERIIDIDNEMEGTCVDLKNFHPLMVPDCLEDYPLATFERGDRDINVNGIQFSHFMEKTIIFLKAKVTAIEPKLNEGSEEAALFSKCLKCKTIVSFQSSQEIKKGGGRLKCKNNACDNSNIGKPMFLFRFTLSHGGGISSALLIRRQARQFFGCTEEEFLANEDTRVRIRKDLEKLLGSDMIHTFCLKLVIGNNNFVYLMQDMKFVTI